MRIYNFNAGPAALPVAVLEQVQHELLELNGSGMSVMEWSHRSKDFEAVNARAENGLRRLLAIPNDYHVLFLGGGASLQFSMAPMNLLQNGACADYLLSGSWGTKALKEAQKHGAARAAASTQTDGFRRVPRLEEFELDTGAKYVHLTSNETIEGVQWPHFPETGGVPIVADMSSDILSYALDWSRFGMVYAGAQKNIGPAGVTVVILKSDWAVEIAELPTMLCYQTHVRERSLYNTPNTFGIYMIALVCEYLEKLGGLKTLELRAREKAQMLYAMLDSSAFYHGFAHSDSRSKMNVTFRLPNETLEEKFVVESMAEGFVGLKGHRSVGGLRASIYNAVPVESVRALVEFMRDFEGRNA